MGNDAVFGYPVRCSAYYCQVATTLGSVNNSNYNGGLELIAKFDPFISEHLIKYGKKEVVGMSLIVLYIINNLYRIHYDYG